MQTLRKVSAGQIKTNKAHEPGVYLFFTYQSDFSHFIMLLSGNWEHSASKDNLLVQFLSKCYISLVNSQICFVSLISKCRIHSQHPYL